MNNFVNDDTKASGSSQKLHYSLKNIILIFCVFYILQWIFSWIISIFILSNMNFLGFNVPNILGSFLSFYITIKHLLTSLRFSESVNEIKGKKNNTTDNRAKKWGVVIVVLVWSLPMLNLLGIFILYLDVHFSGGRSSMGVHTKLIAAILPLATLVLAYEEFNKTRNFGTYSIHKIPTFLAAFELILVLIFVAN